MQDHQNGVSGGIAITHLQEVDSPGRTKVCARISFCPGIIAKSLYRNEENKVVLKSHIYRQWQEK